MLRRLLKWCFFSVFLATLPLGVVILFKSLSGQPAYATLRDSPEILFFTFMMCASSLSDVYEAGEGIRSRPIMLVFAVALAIGLIISAILYGGLVMTTIVTQDMTRFRANLLSLSQIFAFVFLIAGVAVQVFLARLAQPAESGSGGS